MARPLRIHLPGIPCHVIARGNDKRCIFEDDTDYERFLRRFARALRRFEIECAAYSLLWNHYHLLLIPRELPISRAMQQLNSSYCQAFNRRHGRVGHALQGRYTARLVDSEAYLRNVLRYIARNPVDASLTARPEDWRWSSYSAAAGLTPPEPFLAVDRVWRAFDDSDPEIGRRKFIAFVAAPVTGEADGSSEELDTATTRQIEQFLEAHRHTREFAYADRFARRPTVERILAGAETRAHLHEAARMAFLRYGYTLREIGDALGRPPSTVWSWIRGPRKRSGVRSRFSDRRDPSGQKIEI